METEEDKVPETDVGKSLFRLVIGLKQKEVWRQSMTPPIRMGSYSANSQTGIGLVWDLNKSENGDKAG